MASIPKTLPEDVRSAFENRIQSIGDSRAGAMRRLTGNENFADAWGLICANKKARKDITREDRISTLYRACYEAAFLLQRPEMMTRGEARKIAEGLELLAKYERGVFFSPADSKSGFDFLFLREKYRAFAQKIPTGARRRPEARSLAVRLSKIFTEGIGAPCHEATAAIIRAAFGGDCDAATVRAYVSSPARRV